MPNPAIAPVAPVRATQRIPFVSSTAHGRLAVGSVVPELPCDLGSVFVRFSFVTEDHGDSAHRTDLLVPVSFEKQGSRMKLPRKQRHASGRASAPEPVQQYPRAVLLIFTPLDTMSPLYGANTCEDVCGGGAVVVPDSVTVLTVTCCDPHAATEHAHDASAKTVRAKLLLFVSGELALRAGRAVEDELVVGTVVDSIRVPPLAIAERS
jgi:hypothetical protein